MSPYITEGGPGGERTVLEGREYWGDAVLMAERLMNALLGLNRARVTLTDREFQVSAVFEFGSDGLPIRTRIDRYGKFEGLLIPTDIRGCWDLAGENVYWFHFKIKSAAYCQDL